MEAAAGGEVGGVVGAAAGAGRPPAGGSMKRRVTKEYSGTLTDEIVGRQKKSEAGSFRVAKGSTSLQGSVARSLSAAGADAAAQAEAGQTEASATGTGAGAAVLALAQGEHDDYVDDESDTSDDAEDNEEEEEEEEEAAVAAAAAAAASPSSEGKWRGNGAPTALPRKELAKRLSQVSELGSRLTQMLKRNSSSTEGEHEKVDGRTSIDRSTAQKPRHWTDEEDELLRRAVESHGEKNWKKIAESVPGRNHTQCLQRWSKVLVPGLKKGVWEPREDEILIQQAQKQLSERLTQGKTAKIEWGKVKNAIPGRTAKQCRERWVNNLNPEISREQWTRLEDATIMRLFPEMPQKWAAIAKHIPGRTENAVKIRHKTLSRPDYRPDYPDEREGQDAQMRFQRQRQVEQQHMLAEQQRQQMLMQHQHQQHLLLQQQQPPQQHQQHPQMLTQQQLLLLQQQQQMLMQQQLLEPQALGLPYPAAHLQQPPPPPPQQQQQQPRHLQQPLTPIAGGRMMVPFEMAGEFGPGPDPVDGLSSTLSNSQLLDGIESQEAAPSATPLHSSVASSYYALDNLLQSPPEQRKRPSLKHAAAQNNSQTGMSIASIGSSSLLGLVFDDGAGAAPLQPGGLHDMPSTASQRPSLKASQGEFGSWRSTAENLGGGVWDADPEEAIELIGGPIDELVRGASSSRLDFAIPAGSDTLLGGAPLPPPPHHQQQQQQQQQQTRQQMHPHASWVSSGN
jgi:hypothetical protein